MKASSSVGKVILGALRMRARTGYEIKALVDRSTRFFWAASYGQIYPELRRLEGEGLVEGVSEPRGGRQRRVYRLSRSGRAELRDWLLAPELVYEMRDEGLLKLFFAEELDPVEVLGLVRAMRAQKQAVLDRLRQIKIELPPHASGYPLDVLDYGIGMHKWIVDWCLILEHRLEAGTKREVLES